MGEYEDRYPDAYGRGETGEANGTRKRTPPAATSRSEPPPARRSRSDVVRPAHDIRDDVRAQLKANPYIDASEVTVTVHEAEVTLSGAINSLIAVSLARALAENVVGVGRVQTQLKVRPVPHERVYRRPGVATPLPDKPGSR